jgi:c-di-GMP-binding flagellar brake protein YcgR
VSEHARREEDPGADPERIVVECCAAGTPAVVTLCEGGPSLRAAFSAFRDERVELELMDGGPDHVPEDTLCHVSFLYRGRPIFFTAPVRSTDRHGDHLLLWLERPRRIATESSRAAFRIPARRESGPSLEVMGDDGVLRRAILVNLSLTGMFLRFAGERPVLLPDQVVEISLGIDGGPIRLAGVVRRVEDAGVAFFFPDAVSEAPENPIRRVMAMLEREWRARLRS